MWPNFGRQWSKLKRPNEDGRTPPKFKLEVVRFADQNSGNKASKEFKVPRSVIPEWRTKKDDYKKQMDEGEFLNNYNFLQLML